MNLEGLKAFAKLDVTSNRERIYQEINRLQSTNFSIKNKEKNIAESEAKIKSYGFFERTFKRKEYKNVKQTETNKIENLKKEIAHYKSDLQRQDNLKAELKTLEENAVKVAEQYNLPPIVTENPQSFGITEDGVLTIDSSNLPNFTPEEEISMYSSKSKDIYGNYIQQVPDENICMVHKTSYFPTNGKILTNHDGEKCLNKYPRNSYSAFGFVSLVYNNRQTSHYTLNRVVTSHAFGNWSGKGICVLDEFSKHRDEFASIVTADSYTRGSVTLSDQAAIVVTPQVYETLSEEEKSSANIVISNANHGEEFDKSIKAFLVSNNKPLLIGDGDASNHCQSNDYKYDEIGESSSVIFKLLRSDKTIFDKNLTMSGTELERYAYLLTKTHAKNFLKDQTINNQYDIFWHIKDNQGNDAKVSKSLIGNLLFGGFFKNPDGSFTRTDDYKSHMEFLDKLDLSSNDNYNIAIDHYIKQNDLIDLQQKINDIQAEFDSQPEPEMSEVLNMKISDLTKFENLKKLQFATQNMPKNEEHKYSIMNLSPEGLVVDVDCNADSELIKGEYPKNSYIPTEQIWSINDQNFIVPSTIVQESFTPEGEKITTTTERTLGESLEIANQVRVYTPDLEQSTINNNQNQVFEDNYNVEQVQTDPNYVNSLDPALANSNINHANFVNEDEGLEM